MTMADAIAVMNHGRIEQLGRPNELYERPQTGFVARFLGASNLLPGAVDDAGAVRLRSGAVVRVADPLPPRGKPVAVGIRPEKLRLGGGNEANRLAGTVKELSYVGVATQYVVDTADGELAVYVQNIEPGARAVPPGTAVELSFGPESAFVVELTEEEQPV
jgi:spermidine/putrescine transport system ATP-binding protein